jgi:SAM-dependent methyltransferase
MPPLELWESFFDPPAILAALGCRDLSGDVLELGCGYGTFTIPAAAQVRGTVYALDIDPAMVAITADRAARGRLSNVVAELRDFVAAGSGRPAGSVRFVMLFNILHLEDPVALLRETYRSLRPDGTVGVVHWKRSAATPRGPALDIRPSPEQCRRWAEEARLRWVRTEELTGSPWHWGMVLMRA